MTTLGNERTWRAYWWQGLLLWIPAAAWGVKCAPEWRGGEAQRRQKTAAGLREQRTGPSDRIATGTAPGAARPRGFA